MKIPLEYSILRLNWISDFFADMTQVYAENVACVLHISSSEAFDKTCRMVGIMTTDYILLVIDSLWNEIN